MADRIDRLLIRNAVVDNTVLGESIDD